MRGSGDRASDRMKGAETERRSSSDGHLSYLIGALFLGVLSEVGCLGWYSKLYKINVEVGNKDKVCGMYVCGLGVGEGDVDIPSS